MIVKEPPVLLVSDDVEASGAEPEALIEEARQHQRQRVMRRNIALGIAALLVILGLGINQLVRGGGGVRAASRASAPPQHSSTGLLVFSRVDAGKTHITVVDPSGRSRPRDLGPGWGPSWSPDGKQVVFTYEIGRGGRGPSGGLERIFVTNADGSGRHPLPVPSLGSRRFEDWASSWSPDGSRIAFTRTIWPAKAEHNGPTTGFPRSAIYAFDLVHGRLRRVSRTSDNGELPFGATWSPDARRLAYVGDSGRSYSAGSFAHGCTGLHVTNADGTGDHVLAAASRLPDGCVGVWSPTWSPDGHWIAFAHPTKHFGGGTDLYLISPNGKHLHRLTHQPNLINQSPTWSPDGKRIAFAFGRRDRGGPGPGGPGRIHTVVVIARDGSNRHTITSFRGHIFGGPDWQRR